jgi:DHA1 family tetracycline resistance protein-like MFS transporter
MQFFLSPIVGSLSDRYGRKPFLVLSVICMGGPVSALLFTHNMWVYAGLTATLGSCAITLPLTSAYVADVTERHERASALGMLLCMMGLSFIFGPLLGASVYHKLGWEALFALPATTTTLNALYVALVLPESNVQRAEDRAPISWNRRTIVDMVTGPVRLVTASKFYGRIALISLLLNLVLFGFITTFQVCLGSVYSSSTCWWRVPRYAHMLALAGMTALDGPVCHGKCHFPCAVLLHRGVPVYAV